VDKVLLKAKIRQDSGTSAAKKVRAQGMVPAIVYAKKETPVQIGVDQKELIKIIHKHGENAIISLQVEDKGKAKDKTVIIKDIQIDYIKNNVTHIDFQLIKMTERIKVSVPLHTKGDSECPGVKEGGNLEHILHEVEIESLPSNVPKEILVDVTALKIGESIHVGDIKIEGDYKIVDNPDQVAVLVKYETVAEEKTEEESGGEESAAEPEVIKKGKAEEEQGE
jgi:large subunit ribosomal protein L25